MSGRKYNNHVIIFDGIDQAVGKTRKTTPANTLVEQMPSFGVLCNAVGGFEDLDQKGLAKAWRLRFIPLDGAIEFEFGDLKNRIVTADTWRRFRSGL